MVLSATSPAAWINAAPGSRQAVQSVVTLALAQAAAGALVLVALTGLGSAAPALRPLALAAFGAAVAATGLKAQALTRDGAAAALLVGFLTLGAGLPFAAALLCFYVTSSRLTKHGAERKALLDGEHKSGMGERSAKQVAANAGVPTLLAVAHAAVGGGPDAAPLAAAVMAYYACCCGDTWASELGVLSTRKPVLITTLQPCAPGTNGGVSPLGLAASAAGGLAVGYFFATANVLAGSFSGVPPIALAFLPTVLLGLAAGLLGSLLDSVMGATMQYSGQDPVTRMVYNSPKPGLQQLAGVDWLSNSMVNLLSASATALAALVFVASIA